MTGHGERVGDGLYSLLILTVIGVIIGLLWAVAHFIIIPHIDILSKITGGIITIFVAAYILGYLTNDFVDDIREWTDG